MCYIEDIAKLALRSFDHRKLQFSGVTFVQRSWLGSLVMYIHLYPSVMYIQVWHIIVHDIKQLETFCQTVLF